MKQPIAWQMKNEVTLKMMRRFIADVSDQEAGIWLVKERKKVAAFLENGLDALSNSERLKLYGFMEGMFPRTFKRVLAVRLERETDPKCVELLRAIVDIHSESV